MVNKVELVPISEGNRITVKDNEKVIIGRGSSLGCNEKKISRHHAELILKDDNTLWIKPTHANPVFFRTTNGKTIQLTKDIERELNDGDQIGLLPSTYYFRVCFSTDVNNNQDTNNDSDTDLSINNPPTTAFDFDDNDDDDDIQIQSTPSPVKQKPIVVTPKKPTHSVSPVQSPLNTTDQDDKSRKLPKWMAAQTSSPSVIKPTTPSTTKSPYSRNSSYNSTPTTSNKRPTTFDDDDDNSDNEIDEPSNISDSRSPGKVLSRISSTKSFDNTSDAEVESITIKSPSVTKKPRSSGKRRPACQFGSTCYRKNPAHRAEQSHPGDSDYDEPKSSNNDDDNDMTKPECPFGKTCYRQNPQHKRDFRH